MKTNRSSSKNRNNRILVTLLATIVALPALAADVLLPNRVTYNDGTGDSFWCQNDNLRYGSCRPIQISDNKRYLLVEGMAGNACEDTPLGLIELETGKAATIEYDGGCRTPATAQFIRSDRILYVQVIDDQTGHPIETQKVQFE